MKFTTGTIAMFWGSSIDIPPGWQAADGTGGTLDLRNQFIIGAAVGFPAHVSGGSAQHDHAFTSDGHTHFQVRPGIKAFGAGWAEPLDIESLTGTTNNTTMLPPYIGLIYVQKN